MKRLMAVMLSLLIFWYALPVQSDPLKSVVRLMNSERNTGGTGFEVVGRSGKKYTITAKHVCDAGATNADLETGTIPLKIVTVSTTTDLCLLSPAPIPGLLLASNNPKFEDSVRVYGFAWLRGLSISVGLWIGVLPVTVLGVPRSGYSTTAVFPGNSGSPVLNSRNEVIGLVHASMFGLNHRALSVSRDELETFLSRY